MLNLLKRSLFALPMIAATASHATTYNVTAVLSGNDGNYSFSSFHDASDADGNNNPMNGPLLTDILSTGFSGTYNDVTGQLDASLNLQDATATSVSVSGILKFSNGVLDNISDLVLDFNNDNGLLSDTVIGFNPGAICCNSSTNPPNSFDGSVMSLWGANFNYADPSIQATSPNGFNGSYDGSTLGMDLRIELTPVPVPAAIWLLGSGLLGLVAVSRRKA